jgi:uncharacterized membrane protein YfcA
VLGPQEGLVLVSLLGSIGPPSDPVLGPQVGLVLAIVGSLSSARIHIYNGRLNAKHVSL